MGGADALAWSVYRKMFQHSLDVVCAVHISHVVRCTHRFSLLFQSRRVLPVSGREQLPAMAWEGKRSCACRRYKTAVHTLPQVW